jgi:hypothetical protein
MTKTKELERRILIKRKLMELTEKELIVLEKMLREEKEKFDKNVERGTPERPLGSVI